MNDFFGVGYRRSEGLRCVWILESDKKKIDHVRDVTNT